MCTGSLWLSGLMLRNRSFVAYYHFLQSCSTADVFVLIGVTQIDWQFLFLVVPCFHPVVMNLSGCQGMVHADNKSVLWNIANWTFPPLSGAMQYPAGSSVGFGPVLQRLYGLQPCTIKPAQVHPHQEAFCLQSLQPGGRYIDIFFSTSEQFSLVQTAHINGQLAT